jgi:RND superfamily putative drug exporter
VLVAMVSSLTVLPAVLAKLGRRVDRPRLPLLGRLAGRGTGRSWPVLLRPATRHPVLTLVVATAALLALAAPALSMQLNEPGRSTFSEQIPAIATYHRMVGAFPAQAASHLVVVRAGGADASRVVAALDAVARDAQRDPAFGGVTQQAVAASADGRTHTLTLHVPYDPTSDAADRSLRLLCGMLPARLGAVPGASYAVSGDVAHNSDYVASQVAKTPLVVALVMLMTFVMMLVAFRSVVVGLIAVVLNLLSAAAAFGALTAVFQPRWAEGLLGFTSTGFISARVPLFLFVILFGLSMDYQIFVVSRIREHVQHGLDTRTAVQRGITSSAGVITSAAVVMVSVFVSFMFLHLLEVKQTGFALAVAVLLDAAVVRVLILPALLTLLGRASWWPSHLSADTAPTSHIGAGRARGPATVAR